MMQTPLSIVVIDNHPLMRTALSTTLAAEAELQVVGEYTSSQELFEDISTLTPQMILLGIGNPGDDELETIHPLRETFPAAVILALVTGELYGQDKEAINYGAHSVLEKSISRAELISALHHLRRII